MHYIHPESEEIKGFIKELKIEGLPLHEAVEKIFRWFDKNITYSRLSEPYAPLQRSDLDVLAMKSGTCGDFSNLLVSVLLSLGYQTQYAYLKTDCYGNPQDHICVAVWADERWKLVDATLPYRKWHGFDCPHQEYELLLLQEFEEKIKQEENFWTRRAIDWGNERYAGLLYAPWVHEEIIVNADDVLETVFFLLIFDDVRRPQIYVNYLVYSQENASSPVMCRICENKEYYNFSTKEARHLWDDEQWGDEYLSEEVPAEFRTERFQRMSGCIRKIAPEINRIVCEIERSMEKRVYLHVPEQNELWYRKQIMSDRETMSYNRGYEEFEGYNKETGCIAFPEDEWAEWYDYFVGNEPQCFYAYVIRKNDNTFIGEVNLHKSAEQDWHEMGIVIEAKYRGQGYSVEALKLLVKYGFEKMNVNAIHNMFETDRTAAIHTHLSAGFQEYGKCDNMLELLITKDQYERNS